eukprot:TRINITY_DN774028_c0_g1_i1.p1 TRINITY_DN774028_c0_g1~~TRINITY_DN774028_c0_g1_i1.p1  ORF type:complete len:290 (+),score=84.18 TRINITY_DN774028_c0_g1_i1:82-870(+)
MNRSMYDTDVTVWSPQGNLHQVTYAMEAVNKGSICLGIVSNTHAVVASVRRQKCKLSSYQEKVFELDQHMGMTISGLTADGRSLCKFIRKQCTNYQYVHDEPLPLSRLADALSEKHQNCTQVSTRRPYAVGLLIVGVDNTGTHLYQTCPSGNVYEYKAMAIGGRSQSGRTYLEKHFESFPDMEVEGIVHHAVKALRACVPAETELTAENIHVGVVGIDSPFKVMTEEEMTPFLEGLNAQTPPVETAAVDGQTEEEIEAQMEQ